MNCYYSISCLLEHFCQSGTPAAALPPVRPVRRCQGQAEASRAVHGPLSRAGPGCGTAASAAPGARQRALMPVMRRRPAPAAHTCVCTRFTHLFLLGCWVLLCLTGYSSSENSSRSAQGWAGGQERAGTWCEVFTAARILPQGKALQFLPPGSCLQRTKRNTSVLIF